MQTKVASSSGASSSGGLATKDGNAPDSLFSVFVCRFLLPDKISKIYKPLQILNKQFHQPDTGVKGRASHS
jgi:hypothetical protein